MTIPMVMSGVMLGLAVGLAVFAFINLYPGQSNQQQQQHRYQYRQEARNPYRQEPAEAGQRRRRPSSSRGRNDEELDAATTDSFAKTCTICLEDGCQDLARIGCGHYFHLDCLEKLERNVCPNCRRHF